MAQRDPTSTHNEATSQKPMTRRPGSVKLQTSLSHPTPSNPTNQQQISTSRRHLTLPTSLNNNYPQSPAERYIISRSRMLSDSNDQQDIQLESPSSINSSTAKGTISSFQSPIGHTERMHRWHQNKANEICKKQKHRYMYGPPPPSSNTAFPSSMYFMASTQANSSERGNIHSSIPPIRMNLEIQNDELISKKTEQSKTNKSRDKLRMSTVV